MASVLSCNEEGSERKGGGVVGRVRSRARETCSTEVAPLEESLDQMGII